MEIKDRFKYENKIDTLQNIHEQYLESDDPDLGYGFDKYAEHYRDLAQELSNHSNHNDIIKSIQNKDWEKAKNLLIPEE